MAQLSGGDGGRLGSGLGAQPPRVERAQVGREGERGNRQRGFSVGAHGRWARVIAIDSGLHLQGAQDRVAAQDRVVAQDSLWLAVSWGDGEGHSRLGGQGVRHRGDSSEGAGRVCESGACMQAGPRHGVAPQSTYPCDETGTRRTQAGL